jgi:nucleoside-diphosphate-sugar epimerase
MTKQNINIAIFGATGHIGKNLTYYFSKNKKNNLILFGRNKKKIQKIMNQIIPKKKYSFGKYNEFNNKKYDVIINCIGVGNPKDIIQNKDILKITEYYDDKILDYMKNKKSIIYINFSSGAIFGQTIRSPISESSQASINVNKLNEGSYYAISKIYAEIKHRNLKNMNIVDLRIFSFFSRFINLQDEFLIADITNAIKLNKKFITDKNEIIRDYIHPEDLFEIIQKCIKKEKINMALDISSKKPISKFSLLQHLAKKYELNYRISNKIKTSPTGLKSKYYSKSKKIEDLGIFPKYTSLQTILTELKFLID